jgi:molybdopterin-binding protein
MTLCGPVCLRTVCAGRFNPFHYGLFKEKTMSIQAINVRNQFKGKIKEIIRGDVVSEIDVETPWGIVTSVITTRSVDDLALKVGSEVVALVKSTEVSIAKL